VRKQKKTPAGESILADGPAGENKERDLPSRLKRYAGLKARSMAMAEYAMAQAQESNDATLPGDQKAIRKASRIERCGSWLLFRQYYTVDKVRLVKAPFCKIHLLCPFCAARRGGKALKEYWGRYQTLKACERDLRASFVTFTVQHEKKHDLVERFLHLRGAVGNLNQKRRNSLRGLAYRSEWCKVEGFVGSYEFTNGIKNGWHPHFHVIVLHRETIDQAALSSEWKAITGDSHVLEVKEIPDQEKEPGKDFLEVFKYTMKFSDLTIEDNYYAYERLKGKQLIVSGGLFRGVKVPENLEDEPLSEDLPYIEMLYRYTKGKGYGLEKARQGKGGRPDVGRILNNK